MCRRERAQRGLMRLQQLIQILLQFFKHQAIEGEDEVLFGVATVKVDIDFLRSSVLELIKQPHNEAITMIYFVEKPEDV